MIAVDWGTSNFRAYRFDAGGAILERRTFAGGILRIPGRRFAETLSGQVGDWITAGETRILLCGMVGSRLGWVETGYAPCPATLDDLASAVVRIPFAEAEVFLVPGVSGLDRSGIPEVMRGEETEAMGIVGDAGGARLVCHPGTHSKWITLDGRTIESFLTAMTGDVFAALKSATILAQLMNAEAHVHVESFVRGVARSADPGGLLHHLFSVRTLVLTNRLVEDESASYLSGLLIGHEVRHAMPEGAHVHLVGDWSLCGLYARAIRACGGSVTLEDEDAAARGLAAIGGRLSWI